MMKRTNICPSPPVKGTWLARWPAGLKLLLLFVIGTSLVLTDRSTVLLVAATVAALVCFSVNWPRLKHRSGSPLRVSAVVWPMITMAVIVLYIGFFAGFEQAVVVLLRLVALLLFALSVMTTTSVTDMMAVVERVLQPFDRRGWVRADKVALMFGISVRLMPVLLEQWQEISQAQAARGHRANPLALLVPMLARTLERAGEMADAIDARGGSN